jgi:nicotinamidase-related amidase
MQALIVIDVQNEFSKSGKRPVPNQLNALEIIAKRVNMARAEGRPIAWVRHFNKLTESPAFRHGTWGAEFVNGFGPKEGSELEKEFQKNVYGAFTGTNIGSWLNRKNVDEVLIIGFYTHGCVSTTAREAIMEGLSVVMDPDGTGSCDMAHELLGNLTADQARKAALLQLENMGAIISPLSSVREPVS